MDCFDLLPNLPANSVDLILADLDAKRNRLTGKKPPTASRRIQRPPALTSILPHKWSQSSELHRTSFPYQGNAALSLLDWRKMEQDESAALSTPIWKTGVYLRTPILL